MKKVSLDYICTHVNFVHSFKNVKKKLQTFFEAIQSKQPLRLAFLASWGSLHKKDMVNLKHARHI